MADDSGSNSESGDNIMAARRPPPVKGTTVTWAKPGVGVVGRKFATAMAAPSAKPAARVAVKPAIAVTAAAVEAPPDFMPKAAAAAAAAAGGEAEEAVAAGTVMKVRLPSKASRGAVVTNPPPAGAPTYESKEIETSGNAESIEALIMARPVELDPAVKIFRPISASSFNNFMIETFRQYSPMLMAYDLKRAELFAEARTAGAPITLDEASRRAEAIVRAPKPLDKDACKRTDPNKVENFYYQKLVRDYLSRDTPYRGLLVYHGLGSGKTCTSIAAAEALYWGGMKTIYVLTPATLSNNYRRELGKCGYFPLRTTNFWKFLAVPDVNTQGPEFAWLHDVLGLSPKTIQKQGGGWVPNPQKPSNWGTLTDADKESIRAQQREHLAHRFKFIHYNGVVPLILAQIAASGLREGKSPFDDAVVIIDEIHNLVRTINGTQIGGKPISKFVSGRAAAPVAAAGGAGRAAEAVAAVEPREFTWTMPMWRESPGYRYPRGYTLYRLLQNAVGSKIIALSATPMINYAQEIAVLMNLIGGEQRMVSISLAELTRDPTTDRRLREWAQRRPDVDFYSIEQEGRTLFLNLTPVPHGFAKVVSESYMTRGFVRLETVGPVETSRERNMDHWAISLVKDLEEKGFLKAGHVAEDEVAVAEHRAIMARSIEGISSEKVPVLVTKTFALKTLPLLPDDADEFVSTFIDKKTLDIQLPELLKARASGLVSYYRGGSEELMPRTTRNEVVEVPMSDYAFGEYTKARLAELEMEGGAPTESEAAGGGKKAKGMTRQEMDLYTQATKTQQAGFLALSRAACNWVFPESIERPMGSLKDQAKLLGLDQDRVIAADLAVDVDADMEEGAAAATAKKAKSSKAMGGAGAGAGAAAAAEEVEAEETAAALPDEEAAAATVAPRADPATLSVIGRLMAALEAGDGTFLNAELAKYSPKYATILANIRRSPGPVLVYSQFKTLEGLGIFAAVLRAAEERYVQLDIIWDSAANEWVIPAELMTADMIARPRYILYTGDQELDKRRLLLQLYNADIAGLPPRLSAQCAELLRGDPDNRNGKVCQVFMITQSGAEGISMFNTRQVHIMEPYWNNVRIQQVIGRAIRLCSHMNLDWDERTVEVFTYLSVFSAEQKTGGAKGSRQLMLADKGMTTDQMIFDIATKKQKLADGLMEIAQSAAVDCKLHEFEHGKTVHCFRYTGGARPMFMYHPDWQKDKAELEARRTSRIAGAVSGGGGGH